MLLTKDAGALLRKDSGIALKAEAIKEDGTIEGYGSIFGNVDSYGEIVVAGAFTASLEEAKRKGRAIKMLWQHDPWTPIGVWDELAEDSQGLRVKGRLLKDVSPRAAEAHGLLKAGALDGLSIGYRTLDADPDEARPGITLLKKLDLREVSIVTFAANEQARVEAVKHILAAGELPTVREFEGLLRDAGFSKAKAAAMASACTPHLRGDPEAQPDKLQRFMAALRG